MENGKWKLMENGNGNGMKMKMEIIMIIIIIIITTNSPVLKITGTRQLTVW